MNRYVIFLAIVFSIIAGTNVYSQNLTENLNHWEASNPIEKVYLHTDRNLYYAGQTVWMKSYFFSQSKPSLDNSTLFVELLDNQSTIISKKVLPVFNAITYGQMELPDNLSTGTYWLRAYSPLMLNNGKEYLFSSSIQVFGKTIKSKQAAASQVNDKISLHFFPEGGHLVADIDNNIAFKAVNSNGVPVNISGEIKDSKGVVITKFESLHDGMGKFNLLPKVNETYIAIIDNTDQTIALPKAITNGVALKTDQSDGIIHYTLYTSGINEDFLPEYCILQMQNKVLAKLEIDQNNKQKYLGAINTKDFKSGILQLSFFNKDNVPVAERLVFVNNKEYQLTADLTYKKLVSGSRKNNDLELVFPEAVNGNFSISITDADYERPGQKQENILTTLLLTSDLPGYVNNPAWYFSDDAKAPQALDLLMLTNGWQRFNWKDVAANDLPNPQFKDPGYISLSGQVGLRNTNKSFADRELLMWSSTPASGPNIRMVKTDAEGKFQLDSLMFFDKAKILFSDVMGKNSKFITVKLNTDSLYKSYNLPALNRPDLAYQYNKSLATKMQSAYFDYTVGQGLLLDNVAIEGRRLTEDELEKKYVSGLFSGNINARTINLTGQFIPNWNIFEWLVGRVPSLNIQRVGTFGEDYRLFYRQQPVQMFLDEMPMNDAMFITSIPANQLALIKIYPQFIGATGNGSAIAFYTKRGYDLEEEMEISGEILDYDGYSIIKEYNSPDYSIPADVDYKDYRLTLQWQPEVLVANSKSLPISFYNNDRTKRFKIVVEGVTNDGKILMMEKVIEPGK